MKTRQIENRSRRTTIPRLERGFWSALSSETGSTETRREPGERSIAIEMLALVLVIAALWLPRALALDRFVTIDENNWVPRSARFYAALIHGDHAATFLREHPGVTTMWAGAGGVLWRTFPLGDLTAEPIRIDERGLSLRGRSLTVLEILVVGRFFIVLANTVALALAYLFARRLLGLLPAFLGFLLVAFDPFHLAHSRLLHLDGLLSSLLFLALLAYLSFLHRRRLSVLILSGVAAGLSALTKSTAAFLVPTIVVLSGFDACSRRAARQTVQIGRLLWRFVWPPMLWGMVALVIFVALWPAMWVDPLGTLGRVFSQALKYAGGGHTTPEFFAGRIYADGEVATPLFYPITYLWRSTPVVLLGLLLAALAFVLRWGPFSRALTRWAVSGLVLYVIVYAALHTLGTKKFDRYLLPVYAPLDLIAATGWTALASWLAARWPVLRWRYATILLLGAMVVFQATGTVRTFPYYLSYYNPLLGGSKRAPNVMQVGWGEGLDQAARYLDQRPDAGDLQATVWYGQSFSHFFSGETRSLPFRAEFDEAQVQEALNTDYVVAYLHQWQRQIPRQLVEALDLRTPVETISINGLEYARIYKLMNPPAPPEPSQWVDVGVLGGVARLEGYDLPAPPEVTPGATLPLTLTWESLATTDAEYTVFVHLVGPDSRPLAQVDSQPLGGAYPTSYWDVGERLADPYRMHIPEDVLPGEYGLLAGMYLLSTGERLPLLDGDGQPVGDSIPLGRLTIVQP
jgi:hypothetical protein